MHRDGRYALLQRAVMDTDDLLASLAFDLIRDWRRRRDVDPAVRRAWIRRCHPAGTGSPGSDELKPAGRDCSFAPFFDGFYVGSVAGPHLTL